MSNSILGYTFKDSNLLELALRDVTVAKNENSESNRVLAMIGDAVLTLFTLQEMTKRYQGISVSELDSAKNHLVNNDTLNRIARENAIVPNFNGGNDKRYATALEAVIGAIYQEARYEIFYEVLLNLFSKKLETVSLTGIPNDYVKILEKYCDYRGIELRYEIATNIEKSNFRVKIFFDNEVKCNYTGSGSKLKVRRGAAKKALGAIGMIV